MTEQSMPAEIVGDERHIYTAAADRSRKAYRRKHGANVTLTLSERRAWNLAHRDKLAAAAARAGLAAVRKTHRARVDQLATMTDPDRIGGPASGEWLAILERDAAHAAARLEVLAAIGKTPRKTPVRRKSATVETVTEPTPATVPVELAAAVESGRAVVIPIGAPRPAPATVPAPMPRQTRAARRQSRRELADALRAVGLRPAGDVWTLATAGHEPAEIVRQIAEGADLATLAAEMRAEVTA